MSRHVRYPFGRETLADLISVLQSELSGARGLELPILSILLSLHPVESAAVSETGVTLSEISGLCRTNVPRLLNVMEAMGLATFRTAPGDRFEISLGRRGRSLLERILASLDS